MDLKKKVRAQVNKSCISVFLDKSIEEAAFNLWNHK